MASPDFLFFPCYGPVLWRDYPDQAIVNTGQSEPRPVFLLLFTGKTDPDDGQRPSSISLVPAKAETQNTWVIDWIPSISAFTRRP